MVTYLDLLAQHKTSPTSKSPEKVLATSQNGLLICPYEENPALSIVGYQRHEASRTTLGGDSDLFGSAR